PFGELHDIALVDQGDAFALELDGVAQRFFHQPLAAEGGDRLDADAAAGPDRLAEAADEVDHLVRGVGARRPLDAGIDVFDVLAEDDHVDLLRLLDRRRDALEIAHRTHTGVEVEDLAQGDVQAADAAADRRGQRALDGDPVLADGLQGVLREPLAFPVVGLLTGEHFEPGDRPRAAVDLLDSAVERTAGGAPDVGAGAVSLDEGDDRAVRHFQTVLVR